jgi:putative ABC transport system substrate-binding protein
MGRVRRRQFLIASGALLAAPLIAHAQPQGKIWRVGWLAAGARPESIEVLLNSFVRGMRDLGYVESKNLVMEWRFAGGNVERLQELAAELVRLKVDALMSGSSQAISALQKATTTIPIVMASIGDPVATGFVKSLAHPEGNITGLANQTTDLGAKGLELLLDLVPKLSRVAVLANPANPAFAVYLKNVQSAARLRNVHILRMEARTAQEIENAFPAMTLGRAEALIVQADNYFLMHFRKIAELAAKNRLASVSEIREYVEAGGLMSYGPNLTEQFRRAAAYVDKIFKGAKPADLPVEQSTTFELLINGRTAKALGITVPPSILIRADRVIE